MSIFEGGSMSTSSIIITIIQVSNTLRGFSISDEFTHEVAITYDLLFPLFIVVLTLIYGLKRHLRTSE